MTTATEHVNKVENTELGKKFLKQDILIDQIIINPNKSKVALALKAGYATKSIDKTVGRLMKDKNFLERLEDRKRELQARLQVSADRVAEEYARIAFLDPSDYFDYTQDGGIEDNHSGRVHL